MCLFLKQQKNKTAFVCIQALISLQKRLWFRHNWELCERTAARVARDTLRSAFLSSAGTGELGAGELSPRPREGRAPLSQPFILPAQPPPPDPPLLKLLEFKLTPADVQFGPLQAIDTALQTLRAPAGTRQLFSLLSQSSRVSGRAPSPAPKPRVAKNHPRATS